MTRGLAPGMVSTLVVNTGFADAIAIEVEHTGGIATNRSFIVCRLDGEKTTGDLAISEDGQLVVPEISSVRPPQAASLAAVALSLSLPRRG